MTAPKHNTGDVEQLREQFLALGPCIGPYDSPHRCSALHCDHCGLCDISEEVLDLIATRVAEARLDSAIAELARLHMEAPFEEADVVTDAKRETRGQEPLQTLDRYIRARRAQLQAERNGETSR